MECGLSPLGILRGGFGEEGSEDKDVWLKLEIWCSPDVTACGVIICVLWSAILGRMLCGGRRHDNVLSTAMVKEV